MVKLRNCHDLIDKLTEYHNYQQIWMLITQIWLAKKHLVLMMMLPDYDGSA